MDKIVEVKQNVRHDNWKRMYEEYQKSGMKVNGNYSVPPPKA